MALIRYLFYIPLFFLCIINPGAAWAQTQENIYACPGDTVLIKLEGRERGYIDWQFSEDLNSWEAVTGWGLGDSLFLVAHDSSTGYYRALVQEPFCDPVFSDTSILVIGQPNPPVVSGADSIDQEFFRARWKKSTSAGTGLYYLDVALDSNFTNILEQYNDLNVGATDQHLVEGLFCNTDYYFRVRVEMDGCGESIHSGWVRATTADCPVPPECTVPSTCSGDITDARDGKVYKTVQIGTQCWMAQNLNVGTMIQGVYNQTPGVSNQDASIEKYCFNDIPANCGTYGGLYLWDEMMAYGSSNATAPGPRGICPVGWHIPVEQEWVCLEEQLGGQAVAGGKLKSKTGWNPPNTGASNSSGFSALPGGTRTYAGQFRDLGAGGSWWTATQANAQSAWAHYVLYDYVESYQYNYEKAYFGWSVRCVKD